MIGARFGKWTVLKETHSRKGYLTCRCECGTERPVRAYALTKGKSFSCGCNTSERKRAALQGVPRTHGYSGTRTYRSWQAMKARCGNRNHRAFPLYGGRGIRVCSEWLKSFECFLTDMGQKPSDDYTIDRIDSDGNYEPGNCRWATRVEQATNRRGTAHVTYLTQTKTITEWSIDRRIPKRTIANRLDRGWSISRALGYTGSAVSVTAKQCSKCGEIKETNMFSRNRSRKDGLQVYCKMCFSSYEKGACCE